MDIRPSLNVIAFRARQPEEVLNSSIRRPHSSYWRKEGWLDGGSQSAPIACIAIFTQMYWAQAASMRCRDRLLTTADFVPPPDEFRLDLGFEAIQNTEVTASPPDFLKMIALTDVGIFV
jgi:hypothetical protein